jgi:hypothetical protein
MRTMEVVDISKNVDEVLRYIEKNRKPILMLKNGKKQCMMLPVERTKKVRRDSGQAPVG